MTGHLSKPNGAPQVGRPAIRLAGSLGLFGLFGLIGLTGLALVARWFWPGELVSNLGWQIGWAGLTSALLLFPTPRWPPALFAVVCAAWHLWPELSLFIGNAEVADQGPELTIASVNLLWGNNTHVAFVDWLEKERPDIVALHEVSIDWLETIANQSELYPHALFGPGKDAWTDATWGTVLLSKQAPQGAAILPSDLPGPPVLQIVVLFGGREVTVRTAHPMRPGGAWETRLRDALLTALGALEWRPTDSLVGDLNVTSGSPIFHDLLRRTGLNDSRQGFGRLPTWQKDLPFGSLSFAIDHILVGSDLAVLDRSALPMPGSDHKLVIARVTPRSSLRDRR